MQAKDYANQVAWHNRTDQKQDLSSGTFVCHVAVTRIRQLMSLHWCACLSFLSWNIGGLKLLARTVTCSHIQLTSIFHPNTAAIMESQLSQRSATLEQIEQMEKEFQATQLRTMDVTIATFYTTQMKTFWPHQGVCSTTTGSTTLSSSRFTRSNAKWTVESPRIAQTWKKNAPDLWPFLVRS